MVGNGVGKVYIAIRVVGTDVRDGYDSREGVERLVKSFAGQQCRGWKMVFKIVVWLSGSPQSRWSSSFFLEGLLPLL
jgi:hypothetical protein